MTASCGVVPDYSDSKEYRMEAESTEAINTELRDHQKSIEDWDYRATDRKDDKIEDRIGGVVMSRG
jgi:hypothetical protein